MIPEHRLARLLTHVKNDQVLGCTYHNTAKWPSLYFDHHCQRDDLPLETLCQLDEHQDEVWFLQFSHDGTRLATASKDTRVLIYDTTTFKVIHELSDHNQPVAYVAWSPDDSRLVTCSQDNKIKVWNTSVGHLPSGLASKPQLNVAIEWSVCAQHQLACSSCHDRGLGRRQPVIRNRLA